MVISLNENTTVGKTQVIISSSNYLIFVSKITFDRF